MREGADTHLDFCPPSSVLLTSPPPLPSVPLYLLLLLESLATRAACSAMTSVIVAKPKKDDDDEEGAIDVDVPSIAPKPAEGQAAYRGTAVKQRNRRMFGALMGHLAKANTQLKKDSGLIGRQQQRASLAQRRNAERSREIIEGAKVRKQAQLEQEARRRRAMREAAEAERELDDYGKLRRQWEENHRQTAPWVVGSKGEGSDAAAPAADSAADSAAGAGAAAATTGDDGVADSAGDNKGGGDDAALSGFLVTNTSPALFWAPRQWSRRTKRLLDDRNVDAAEEIARRRAEWDEEEDKLRQRHALLLQEAKRQGVSSGSAYARA